MGTSTDAILAYGVDTPWEENDTPWAETYDDLDDWLLEMFGVHIDCPEPKDWGNVTPAEGEVLSVYYKALREAIAEVPVEVVIHCHHECPMYLLALRGHVHTANRGDVLEVDQCISSEISEGQITAFMDFCEKVGLEREPPRWLLVSMWS